MYKAAHDQLKFHREFCAKHGGIENAVVMGPDGRPTQNQFAARVFESAAVYIPGTDGMPPEYREPPKARGHRLRIQLEYYTARLEAAEQAFHHAKIVLRNAEVARHWQGIAKELRAKLARVRDTPEMRAAEREKEQERVHKAEVERDRIQHFRAIDRELAGLTLEDE